MGRKRTWTRKFIYFCIAGLILFVLFGCASIVKREKPESIVEKEKPDSIVEKEEAEWKEEPVQKEKIQKESLSKESLPREKAPKDKPPKEEPPKLSEHLLRARKLLEQRDFDGSLKENQKVLSVSGQNSPADEAVFNMGLIYAHFGNPKKDYSKSIVFFRKLMKEYPQSPFTEQARVWTGILQENEKLSQTIQKLNQVIEESKDVDIQIEEKKREKAK